MGLFAVPVPPVTTLVTAPPADVVIVVGLLVVVEAVGPVVPAPAPVALGATKAAYTGVIWVAIMAAITVVVIKLCFNLGFMICP
jgi:hypothetical protein